MLYRTLKRVLARKQNDGMGENLDIFFAAGKLTQTEYAELSAMLEV